MIKNNNQLSNAHKRLDDIRSLINELKSDDKGSRNHMLLSSMIRDRDQLISEINEYHDLCEFTLDELFRTSLNKPVLLSRIGELLAKLRLAAKLTQSELAEKMGWNQANVSRFENENYNGQTISKVSQFAGAMGFYLYVTPSLEELPIEKKQEVEYDQIKENVQRSLLLEEEPDLDDSYITDLVNPVSKDNFEMRALWFGSSYIDTASSELSEPEVTT